MTEDFQVNVYESATMGEAELVRQSLEQAGIEAMIDQMPSPLDGLSAIHQGTSVLVRPSDEKRASAVVREWMAENKYHDEEE